MPESPKTRLRLRDVVILLAVAFAFVVIIGILWQGFLTAD